MLTIREEEIKITASQDIYKTKEGSISEDFSDFVNLFKTPSDFNILLKLLNNKEISAKIFFRKILRCPYFSESVDPEVFNRFRQSLKFMLENLDLVNLELTEISLAGTNFLFFWAIFPNDPILKKLFWPLIYSTYPNLKNLIDFVLMENRGVSMIEREKQLIFIKNLSNVKDLNFEELKQKLAKLKKYFGIENFWNYSFNYLNRMYKTAEMLENKEIDKNFKFGIRWVSSYDTNGAWKKYLDDEYNDIVFDDLDKNSFHIISIEAKDPVSLAEKFRFIKKEFGAACFCIFNYHGSENSFRFSESNSMNLNAFKSESDRILRFADLILKEGGQILLQGCKQGLSDGFGDVISSPRYKVFAHPDTTGPIIIKFNEMGIKSVIDYDLEEGKMVPFRIIQK